MDWLPSVAESQVNLEERYGSRAAQRSISRLTVTLGCRVARIPWLCGPDFRRECLCGGMLDCATDLRSGTSAVKPAPAVQCRSMPAEQYEGSLDSGRVLGSLACTDLGQEGLDGGEELLGLLSLRIMPCFANHCEPRMG
jgi:hypothetical protein